MQASGLVERAEDLVEHEQRQRLARPLGDHLRDREPQHEARDVLLAARDDRLGTPPSRMVRVVVLRQVELVVAAVGQVGQESRRRARRSSGRMRRVQLAPQVREPRSNSLWRRWRALSAAIWRSRWARSASRRFVSARSSSARLSSPRAFDDRELGFAQRPHGPIRTILRLPVLGVREALGANGLGEPRTRRSPVESCCSARSASCTRRSARRARSSKHRAPRARAGDLERCLAAPGGYDARAP